MVNASSRTMANNKRLLPMVALLPGVLAAADRPTAVSIRRRETAAAGDFRRIIKHLLPRQT